MRRFLVKVQYNGKDYSGFQKNSNGKTIEGEIEKALEKVFERHIDIVGVSRTDAGVSAREYYFHFDTDTTLPCARVAYKLNRYLPKDIVCQESIEVLDKFDARKDVVDKTYLYTLYVGQFVRPLVNRYAYLASDNLDIDNMRKCSQVLLGRHDFSAFCSSGADAKSKVRTIKNIDIKENSDTIEVYITGDGFLYNMVRIIVGTLIECGKGVISKDNLSAILQNGDRVNAGIKLPPKALMLYSVNYGDMLEKCKLPDKKK